MLPLAGAGPVEQPGQDRHGPEVSPDVVEVGEGPTCGGRPGSPTRKVSPVRAWAVGPMVTWEVSGPSWPKPHIET